MAIKKITQVHYEDEQGFKYQFEPVEESSIIRIGTPDGGYKVGYITKDEDPESPESWQDDGAFLLHDHRQFYVWRKEIDKEALATLCGFAGIIPEPAEDDGLDAVRELAEKYWIFHVQAYIHSGVHLSIGQGQRGWDVSHCGAVLMQKTEFPEVDKAEKYAAGLVEEWNQYLAGEVFGVIIETWNGDAEYVDHESLWGIYGEEGAVEELKTMLGQKAAEEI